MIKYEVGQKIEEFANGIDGAQFDMTDSGGILLLRFNAPSNKELEEIKNGRIQYSISYLNDVIYLLWKFGNLEYLETPYSFSASKNLTELQDPVENTGYAINVILIDSANGEVKAIKLISLDNRSSKKLLELISKQPYMPIEEYYTKVLQVQNKYTTKEILKYKIVSGKID